MLGTSQSQSQSYRERTHKGYDRAAQALSCHMERGLLNTPPKLTSSSADNYGNRCAHQNQWHEESQLSVPVAMLVQVRRLSAPARCIRVGSSHTCIWWRLAVCPSRVLAPSCLCPTRLSSAPPRDVDCPNLQDSSAGY
eukprot:350396-Chlamydomonas_euryale.AAC.1